MDSSDGKIIIFASPSGGGKTTVAQHLLSKYNELAFSVSATTREKRSYEVDGQHYYFISVEEFRKRIEAGEFLEWQQVYEGLYYGTLIAELERLWKEGKTILLDVDVQGALNVKKQYGNRVLAVFVKPPSEEVLIERLKNRGTENAERLQKRIAKVKFELTFENKFDKLLVNDKLEDTLVNAERLVEDFVTLTPRTF